MLDTIRISVDELYERAKEMKDDGMDYVVLTILEDDTPKSSDLEPMPNCVHFGCHSKTEPYAEIDYETIDEASEED